MIEKTIKFILIFIVTVSILFSLIQYPLIIEFLEKNYLILIIVVSAIFIRNITYIIDKIKNFSLKENYRYLKVEWINGILLGLIAFLVLNKIITNFSTILILTKLYFLFGIIQFAIFYKGKTNKKDLYVFPSSNAFFEIINKTQPISHLKEDKLNVSKWVKKVTNLLRSSRSSILIIGINGKWGAGKTSLINLISNELPKNEFIHFSSWDYLNNNKLTEYLLNKIGVQLDRLTKRNSFFSNLFDAIYISSSKSPIKGINFAYKTTFNLFSKNPKERLKIKLQKELSSPLVIFIDDLDRLEKNEFLEVIRAVYLLADLPNIRFVLAYDKIHVLKLLFNEEEHSKSIDFFSKLVNFEFNLNVHPERIRRDFFVKILEEYTKKFNHTEIENLKNLISFVNDDTCAYHIFKLLETPREIRKILAFSIWACIDHEGNSQFDMVDMFILSVIQYRIPKLYSEFQKRAEEIKDELCSRLRIKPFNYAVSLAENKKNVKDSNRQVKNKQKEVLNELFNLDNIDENISKEILEDLLNRLFPPLLLLHSSISLDEILKEKKICHPAVFESYLNLESESYSSLYIEIVNILRKIKPNNYEAYGSFIIKYKTELKEHNLWEDFIKYNLIVLENVAIESFIKGIFKISKNLETNDNLRAESDIYGRRVCQLLAGLKVKNYDDDQIFEILKDVIELNPSYGIYSFTIHVLLNPSTDFLEEDYQIHKGKRDKFNNMLIEYAKGYFFNDSNNVTKYDFCGLIFWTKMDDVVRKNILLILSQKQEYLFWVLDFFIRHSSNKKYLDETLGYDTVKKIIDDTLNFNSLSQNEQKLIRRFNELCSSDKSN